MNLRLKYYLLVILPLLAIVSQKMGEIDWWLLGC
ncbi:quorum-sensing system DWW-type pheromone [Streptococcus sp. S784/96/1]